MNNKKLSIVVPVYFNAGSLPNLFDEFTLKFKIIHKQMFICAESCYTYK